MRKSMYLLASLLFACSAIWAQDATYGISFSGFVKADHFVDSRQTVTAREGHFLLYPVAEKLDEAGDDINAAPNFNQLAIQTRLTGKITAPDAFGAKTSGVIEGAFFGHSDSDINGFRLRHAFMKLSWEKTSLYFGQYWHPMFVTAVFPGVVSFNTGVPFQPFSRNPQFRLEQALGSSGTFILALLSQRDFASPGGSTSLRNAVLPNVHAQVQLTPGKSVLGAGVDYKMLRPLLEEGGAKTTETVTGLSLIGYAKTNLGNMTVKVEGVLGQNLFDHLMIGGYGAMAQLTEKDQTQYTTMNNMSVWAEIHGNGSKLQPGVFFGYTQNLGAGDEINAAALSARGSNLKDVLRVSPRLVFKSGKSQLAGELEMTQAGYATGADNKGKPEGDTNSVMNIRLLISAILSF